MLQKINRGDVYFYNFGFDYDGSVEGKNRPCVIISNNKGNNYGTTALVAPITTRSKESCKPWQVHYYNGDKSQIILCEQIKTVNVSKLYNYQGHLDTLTMRAVDEALAIEFDLNVTQKEQTSTEFLHRLDAAMIKITEAHLTRYDKKVNKIITNALSITNSYKNTYKQMCDEIIDKITTVIGSKYGDVITELNDIKLIFNKNSDNIDKVLSSLITIYENLNTTIQSSDMTLPTFEQNTIEVKSTNDEKEIKRKPRYTLEDAQTMVEDYYNMTRPEFMLKYDLKNQTACDNRLTTMKNILKKNGIDYKNIKNKVTVYNLNDLSEDEKREKFSKYLRGNRTLAVVNNESINKTQDNSTSSKRNVNWQPAINYDNIQELLDFIDECNKNSVTFICDKYGLTKKQLSNRKYLITQSLKARNIPYTIIRKSRKDG